MLNESPFSTISNYIRNNNLVFHNESSNKLKDSCSDFFSVEDKKKQNFQPRTKQRFGFYNNGSPSQIKQYLDYFLKESNTSNDNINFICFTGNDFSLNYSKNDNNKEKLKNSQTKEKKNIHQDNPPDICFNNYKSKNDEINEDDKDNSCPAPPCKNSMNSCISSSTFNSSTNSNINNNINSEQMEGNFNLLTNDLGKMTLNEKNINPHILGRVNKLSLGY